MVDAVTPESIHQVIRKLYRQIDKTETALKNASMKVLELAYKNRKLEEQVKELTKYRDAHILYQETDTGFGGDL